MRSERLSADLPDREGQVQPASTSRSWTPTGYLLGLVGGLGVSLAAFGGLLAGLQQTGHLPPPAFSNSVCVDEKLSFMRNNRINDANLLVVGSSVAWRHVDGETLVEHAPGTRPMNGAFCGLRANQTLYVASWLLDREQSIREVVMVVDPIDFAGCAASRDAVFDREHADGYVYQGAWGWQYYMRYFSPASLVRNAVGIKAQRTDPQHINALAFNRYGDGPLKAPGSRGLFYGEGEPLDAACFGALRQLATRLDREGRPFTVVSTPLHPEWKARFDARGELVESFDQRLHTALQGTGARYWNANREWAPAEELFVDAIHMRWPAAQAFTRQLAERLESGRTLAGPL